MSIFGATSTPVLERYKLDLVAFTINLRRSLIDFYPIDLSLSVISPSTPTHSKVFTGNQST